MTDITFTGNPRVLPPGIELATWLRMSPMARVLHERFEEICRAELVRLRRKTASLSATHRAELDVISLSVARAIAARLSDAIDRRPGRRDPACREPPVRGSTTRVIALSHVGSTTRRGQYERHRDRRGNLVRTWRRHRSAQDAKVQKGMQVFAAQKCSQCHSIAGKGNAKGKLDDVASKVSPAEMKEWITDPVGMAAKNKKDRKPPMKKKPISDAEVDALVAYLSTLK